MKSKQNLTELLAASHRTLCEIVRMELQRLLAQAQQGPLDGTAGRKMETYSRIIFTASKELREQAASDAIRAELSQMTTQELRALAKSLTTQQEASEENLALVSLD